jgi:D-sedoheptulose 7-phosphate isomerase
MHLGVEISGSGNSPNVLRAVEWANRHDLKMFGCTGFGGGKLRALAQRSLHVPLDGMGTVETIHPAAFHRVVDELHRRIAL